MDLRVLIIDDDPFYVKLTKDYLESNGFVVTIAQSGESGIELWCANEIDIVLLDQDLPDMNALKVLDQVNPSLNDTVVLVITAHSSVGLAVDCLKAGADNFIAKPCKNEEILFKIKKEYELKKLKKELTTLKSTLKENLHFDNIIGHSGGLSHTIKDLRLVLNSDATLLITGETGTGKSLLAKSIHYQSDRERSRFVTLSVGTIPEDVLASQLFGHLKGAFTGAHQEKQGLLRMADGGTLFIDEVGEMPPSVQLALLKVIEEKEFYPVGSDIAQKVDVRIIAATNIDLKGAILKKTFREDLFYRLDVLSFEMPPLRERQEDILDLIEHFLSVYVRKYTRPSIKFSPEALRAMTYFSWPGNIRQLENMIERLVLLSSSTIIELEQLPIELKESTKYKNQNKIMQSIDSDGNYADQLDHWVSRFEKEYFLGLLEKYKGNISKVAHVAGLNRKTVYRKIEKYQIQI